MDKALIKKTAIHLLQLMDITDPQVSVTTTEDHYTVDIHTSDEQKGSLIGYHGETIGSLELILSLIVNQDEEKWQRLFLNIGDYRQRREQALSEIAQNAASRAKATGKEITLTGLPSNERRLVHLALADDPQVETTSVGEGRFRRLIIRPLSTPATS